MRKAHLDLKALRHVATLARTLNYTKAARELNLSQSALTRSIQNTEQRSGLRIFDRDRGGVHLTPAGKTFVERAANLIREADDFDRQIQRMAGGEDYEVAFGMAPLPAKTLLPELATDALAQQTELRWRVDINSAPELLRALLEEKIEFFLCAEEQFPDNTPVKALRLGDFPLSFIVRKDHPLLNNRDEGQNYPVISVAPIPNYQSFPASLVPALEYPPKLVVNDYALLATITSQTDAVWPMSSFAVMDELKSGQLETLDIATGKHPSHFSILMYSLAKRSLSPAALKLQAHFRDRIQLLRKLL